MLRRVLLTLTVSLVVATPAVADLSSKKSDVDARLGRLHSQIAAAKQRESSLSVDIAVTTSQIRVLEGQVGDVSGQLVVLERDLELHRQRLARLSELLRVQTRRFHQLRSDYALALGRFNRRLVLIYQQADVGTLDIVLSATSFTDLLERLDFSRQIGSQDKRIAGEISRAKQELRLARARTARTRSAVRSATRVIAVRTDQAQEIRNRLLARKSALTETRGRSQQAVTSVRETAREAASEAEALQSVSAQLAAQIQAAAAQAAAREAAAARAATRQAAAARAAQAVSVPPSTSSSSPPATGDATAPQPSTPVDSSSSSSGLIWPVNGPVVSPFGMRWGRMHEGLDIGVPSGTPIRAAAAGIVIYAGWMGGYGNLIILQHSGSLATAYAHQSSFAVGSGAHVAQGETIGYVGCTGHCFGPHLHFEVRVNGTAVDPLGYL